ncbi:hypothetical protein RclHR1_34480002 [Rhizophagus clarus]|uniref:Uncharacterized protein n=1 Tax=Rhizophagus clarus TaxID=94130 RepID=A0A2Z6RA41_9GLOM|nr:hypothetical protein RclHR1_34480002 [Rhizophagus clarus]
MNGYKFFHYIHDNFFHIICQIIPQSSASVDDHDYDHSFFYNGPTANYFITCNLLSNSLIINRKIYGANIDIENLERKESITLNQKLDLEQDLKQTLPFYFTSNPIPNRKIRTTFNEDLNSLHRCNTRAFMIINRQDNYLHHQNGNL